MNNHVMAKDSESHNKYGFMTRVIKSEDSRSRSCNSLLKCTW